MNTSPRSAPARRWLIALSVMLTAWTVPALAPVHAAPRVPATVARTLRLGPSPINRTIVLPVRANMVGVSWTGAGDASMRWRTVGGAWSAWQALEVSDNAPDRAPGITEGRTGRIATEPAWVGTADRVGLRVTGVAQDIRLHLVDTLGDSQPANIFGRVIGAVGRFFNGSPGSVAEAATSQPAIISRAGWGANESWRRCCPKYSPTVEVAFVHHTSTTNSYTPAEVPGIIRAMYHYHRFSRDFDDIAYQFLIDRYGKIYEGRYGGIDKAVIGAHTEGMNSKTTGIALIGTFSSVAPPAAQIAALQSLLAWKLDVHHIPAYGLVQMTSGGSAKLKKNQVVSMNRISGHRDAQATDCPGNVLYNKLGAIRAATGKIGVPKFYLNSTPLTLRPDGDAVNDTITTKVWFSTTMTWKFAYSDVSGAAKKEFLGAGTVAEVTWDGKDALTGAYGATGPGAITITGTNAAGQVARPATVMIDYVFTHPPGTVLSAGGTKVWLDANGARAIPSDGIAASWFRNNEIIATTSAELSRYPASSPPLGYRDGAILKTPDGVYHFVAAGLRRDFATPQLYAALGYTDASAIAVPQAEADALPRGAMIDNPTLHPDAAVVVDSNKVSWVLAGGTKRKIPSVVIRRSMYRDAEAAPATAADTALPEGTPLSLREGSLVKTPEGTTWLVFAGKRRMFVDSLFFAAFGYPAAAAQSAAWSDLAGIAYGGVIGS